MALPWADPFVSSSAICTVTVPNVSSHQQFKSQHDLGNSFWQDVVQASADFQLQCAARRAAAREATKQLQDLLDQNNAREQQLHACLTKLHGLHCECVQQLVASNQQLMLEQLPQPPQQHTMLQQLPQQQAMLQQPWDASHMHSLAQGQQAQLASHQKQHTTEVLVTSITHLALQLADLQKVIVHVARELANTRSEMQQSTMQLQAYLERSHAALAANLGQQGRKLDAILRCADGSSKLQASVNSLEAVPCPQGGVVPTQVKAQQRRAKFVKTIQDVPLHLTPEEQQEEQGQPDQAALVAPGEHGTRLQVAVQHGKAAQNVVVILPFTIDLGWIIPNVRVSGARRAQQQWAEWQGRMIGQLTIEQVLEDWDDGLFDRSLKERIAPMRVLEHSLLRNVWRWGTSLGLSRNVGFWKLIIYALHARVTGMPRHAKDLPPVGGYAKMPLSAAIAELNGMLAAMRDQCGDNAASKTANKLSLSGLVREVLPSVSWGASEYETQVLMSDNSMFLMPSSSWHEWVQPAVAADVPLASARAARLAALRRQGGAKRNRAE